VNSIYFRLSTGTGGFVLLSLLILAFVIYRCPSTQPCRGWPLLPDARTKCKPAMERCGDHLAQREPGLMLAYRSVPNKKTMAATLALFGSTVLSAARYFVGSWFPSLEQLMYNKVRLAGMHTPASTQDFCRQQRPSIAQFEHSTPSTPSI
jgi:hypothetical protein